MPAEFNVRDAGFTGPIEVPKMDTISPGETGPLTKLAAFNTAAMLGSGLVTLSDTFTVTEPCVPLTPLTVIVPV